VFPLILAAALGPAALGAWPPPQAAPQAASGGARVEPPSAVSTPVQGRQPADPVADAYFEFTRGWILQDESDIEGAIAAFERARKLDPSSADVPAALAELYARQNRVAEASDLAEAALKIRPTHSGAHLILGSIHASFAEREGQVSQAAPGAPGHRQQALEHLESALEEARPDVAVSVRLTLGRLYLRGGEADKAIASLRQLLADEPWLPQGVSMLAQAYTNAGRQDEAIALLKDASVVEPTFYEALGGAFEKAERWEEAAAAFEQASIRDPTDTDIKTRWASALLNMPGRGNPGQARDLLVDVTKTNPTSGWPLYLLSRAQRETGDLDGAETSARRLMAISPASPSGAHALAQVLEARRDWAGIVEALEPVAAKDQKGSGPDRAMVLAHLGFAYLELGRHADAVRAFERASAMDPDESANRVYLAQALIASKSYDRALGLLRAEARERRANLRIARLEAEALRGLGRFDEGAAVLRALADSAPQEPDPVQHLAEYYAAANRYAEAAAVLKAALPRFPGDVDVLFQYGAMLERQAERGEAERVFREVLAKDEAHAPTLNYLGYTLVERTGRVAEGLALIQRAVALDPHNGAYLDSLGWAHVKLGQLDLAEPHLKAAAAQLPRDSVVQDHWGDWLFRKGRYAEAVEAWRKSLAGDGEQIERRTVERKMRDALNKLAKD